MQQPVRPPRVLLDLGSARLVLVQVDGDQYAVEVDGARRSIRSCQRWGSASESGHVVAGEPRRTSGSTANLDPLLRCLELGARQSSLAGGGLQLSAHDAWGHFRQNTWLVVTLALAEDGALEVDADISVQDESYY